MERCNGCGRKKENTMNTAYLIDRSKKEGVCPECKDHLEKEDLDTYTHTALGGCCNVVNGRTPQDLAESLFRSIGREHRHLQNEFFIALWKFFELYGAQGENQRDQRNEWAVKVAKRWHEATFE